MEKTVILASGKYGEYVVPRIKYEIAIKLLTKRAERENKSDIDYIGFYRFFTLSTLQYLFPEHKLSLFSNS